MTHIIFDPPIWDDHCESWCIKCSQNSCDEDPSHEAEAPGRCDEYIAMACTICGQQYWYTLEDEQDDEYGVQELLARTDRQFDLIYPRSRHAQSRR